MKEVRPINNAAEFVDALEECGGDLEEFCNTYSPREDKHVWLFHVEKALAKEPEQLKRWEEGVKLGLKIRLKLLQTAALAKLEGFQSETKSGAPDIAYAKLLLDDILTERNESVKWRVGQPFRRELRTMGENGRDPEAVEAGGGEDAGLKQLEADLAS